MIDLKERDKESRYKISEYPKDYELKGFDNGFDNFRIFIAETTLEKIDDYLSSDINNELGGVLVGDICINKEGKKFILIDNFIIAEHTNSSLSRLTFTHETWSYINENLEKNFPEKKILGWYHSHPGHTVFLSNFDIFIQENFFNIDYMIAYVFDPTIKERGFFFWKEKKIVRSKGFYVYNIKNKENQPELHKFQDNLNLLYTDPPEDKEKHSMNSDFKNNIILGILILNLLLLILVIYNFYDLNRRTLLKEEYYSNLARLDNEIKKVREQLENSIIDVNLKKNSIQSSDTVYSKYEVKDNDTLEKIAFEFYKNRKRTDILIKQNNLQSKWDIKPGQILNIPKLP